MDKAFPQLMFCCEDNQGYELSCFYIAEQRQYQVMVKKDEIVLSKLIPCHYEPVFGMDLFDLQATYKAADEMAEAIEKKLNTNN